MKDNNFLKVNGIILIVLGAIGTMAYAMLFIIYLCFNLKLFNGIVLTTSVLQAAFSILTGIVNLVYRNKVEKAKLCLVANIVLICFRILDFFTGITYCSGNRPLFIFFTLLINIIWVIFPLLSIYGALLNKNCVHWMITIVWIV